MPRRGRLAREQRLNAEQKLKRGELKALVATSSLELGIDVGHVDLVCQIATPRAISALLQRVVRAVDVVARYGGEEFVVVLPETGPTGAAAFAERLRELFESHAFAQARGVTVRLTTSIGVSSFPGFGIESVDDLFAAADQALYRAKSEGRNRVRA